MSVFACLSIRSHNSKIARLNFTKFLYMLPVTVARSSSDGAAIRYVRPVLWMTSFSYHVQHDVVGLFVPIAERTLAWE